MQILPMATTATRRRVCAREHLDIARRSFDDTTLWRISAYEQLLADGSGSGIARLARTTVLPTSLHAELSQLGQHHQ